MNPDRGLAVTGTGCVTPLGAGAERLLAGWRGGECGIRPIRRFDPSALPVRLGGEIPEQVDCGTRAADEPRALAHLRPALREALAESGLPRGSRAVVLVATIKGLLESGAQIAAGAPEAAVAAAPRRIAAELRDSHGLVIAPGGAAVVSAACASGVAALTAALALRERLGTGGPYGPDGLDGLDAILVVGVDLLSDFVFTGFSSLGAVDPEPCRPFDARRAGMSVGEAAAVLVLEREERARARGVRPAGRLLGGGLANDATHPTAPRRDGRGLAAAVGAALAAAGVAPADLGHVHAHGTGTVYNDAMEVAALRLALGDAAGSVPVTTLKGTVGHCLGPAGLVELIASLRAVRAGRLPGIRGLAEPEPGLALLREEVPLGSPLLLKTSAGFGGLNGAVVAEGLPA